jgi:uncharacterized protein YegP (UPF0339 family)
MSELARGAVIVYPSKADKGKRGLRWAWHRMHPNGNLVVMGLQTYTRRANAITAANRYTHRRTPIYAYPPGTLPGLVMKTWAFVKKAIDAGELERVNGNENREQPRGTVEIYEDEKGEHRWRGKSTNGQTVCGSGEGYKNATHAAKMASSYSPVEFNFQN